VLGSGNLESKDAKYALRTAKPVLMKKYQFISKKTIAQNKGNGQKNDGVSQKIEIRAKEFYLEFSETIRFLNSAIIAGTLIFTGQRSIQRPHLKHV